MAAYTEVIDKLVKNLTQLPGIGPKSAERIIFHILKNEASFAQEFAKSILEVKEQIQFCRRCFNLATETHCHICNDLSRDQKTICVVEEPKDVMAFEKAGGYQGLYHVLLGTISPIDGIGPSSLKIPELMDRIEKEGVEEIILATNPSAEGDATATYLATHLDKQKVRVTRISKGVPIGSSFDYMDQATLAHALKERRVVSVQN